MAEYQEITDTEVQPEAPLTSSLGVRFRDNPLALAAGATGAPRIQTAALNNSAVTTVKINNSAVTQAKLAANAAGRSELKMGANSVSGTLGVGEEVAIALTDYALFPSMHDGSGDGGSLRLELSSEGSSSAAAPKFRIENISSGSRSYSVAWRFVQT